ncbi:hypothetical protein F4802DRAFT_249011 [Xylaria palmicola]|nr:hypothetical protein F4802DRAFT_249011 [Xylaria palmicola]
MRSLGNMVLRCITRVGLAVLSSACPTSAATPHHPVNPSRSTKYNFTSAPRSQAPHDRLCFNSYQSPLLPCQLTPFSLLIPL